MLVHPLSLFIGSRCVVFLAAAFTFLSTTSADWPRFRGPTDDGIAPADCHPPIQWSRESNIAWRTELPGKGWSTPVVVGDRIYVSTAIAASPAEKDQVSPVDLDLSLVILDTKTGKLLTTKSLISQKKSETPRTHKKNSHASPSPIVTADRVFVHFGYQGTACTDLDGNVIWVNRELKFKPTHGNGGTPVLVSGKLVFTCDGGKEPKIAALDASSGQVAWTTPRPVKAKKTFSFCTPSVVNVDGQDQIVAPGSDCVLGLDPRTGETLWEVRYTGYSVVPKPVFDEKRLYVSTSFDRAKLLAIRTGGNGDITDSHVDWQLERNVSKTPSMIVHEGLIYLVSDDGIVSCVDTESGKVQYRERLGGKFSSSPVLAAGRIYFVNESGETTVIKAGEDYEVLAENDLAERTLASPAVVGNAIYLRTFDALYRIER